jgi:hypothetical protein
VQNGHAPTDPAVRLTDSARGWGTHAHFGMIEGQAVNLSERGVYFVCRENVMTGEEVEMFFTIPSELTDGPPKAFVAKRASFTPNR